MKRIILVLLTLAGISASAAIAGSCGYRGYSYSYTPSYAYTYTPSYGYSSSYGSGSYYWPGGYWPGGGGYGAGYYRAGYYPNYGYNYYEQPTFVKYQAVIPLVSLPTYGAYYQEPPPAASAPCTMHAGTAASPAASAPAAYAGGAAPAADGKIDRILVLAEQTSGRLMRVEARLDVLEGKRSPMPELAARAAAATPPAAAPAPASGEKPDGPSILHTRCAACHDSKVVATARSKVTLFATGPDGPEMTSVNAKGELEPLSTATLKKVERVLADGTMPPPKDATGKAVAQMAQGERQGALEFLRQALAGGTK